MAKYRITIDGFIRRSREIPEDLRRASVRGFQAAGLVLAAEVPVQISRTSPHPAVDTGALRNSVQFTPLPDGCVVSVTAPHAAPIENGTRPFSPPLRPLIEWALRKGLADTEEEAKQVAFRVRAAIRRRGIAPRYYFRTAWQKSRPAMRRAIKAELDKLPYGTVRVRISKGGDGPSGKMG